MRNACPPTERRPAEGDRVLVKPFRLRRQRQVVHARAARTHPDDGDVVRVATVILDVVLNPSKDHDNSNVVIFI